MRWRRAKSWMCCVLDNPKRPGVVRIVGRSQTGKTTLVERLLASLHARGLRVGTVKHAHHGFDLDRPGKDSWRHARAGAAAVALISPTRSAWLVKTPREISEREAIRPIAHGVDLILVEGFKESGGRRIVLETGGGSRLMIQGEICQLGVPVERLTASEIRTIAKFCVRGSANHLS